jgi:hypothetical protein
MTKLTDAQINAAVASLFPKQAPKASITRRQPQFITGKPRLGSQGALTATRKGTLTSQAAGLIGRLTGDTRQSHRFADKLGNVSDVINPASWATNLGYSARQLSANPTVSNGVDTALNALDALPGVGKGAAALGHMALPALKKGSAKIVKAARRAAVAEDFAPHNIKSLLDHDDWSILTAENPMGKAATPEFNAKQMAALRADLEAGGHKVIDGGVGKYGNHENVLVVTGINEKQARHLGNKYKQDSVLTNRGLVYHDGSVHPARGVNTFDQAPEDFYTSLPNGSNFAVDLDFDNLIPAPSQPHMAAPTTQPIRAYHGTNKTFDEFDMSKGGAVWGASDTDNVMWFASERQRADAAARDAVEAHGEDAGDPVVMERFLDFRNPMHFDNSHRQTSFAKEIAEARRLGHDGLVITPGEFGGSEYVAFNSGQIKKDMPDAALPVPKGVLAAAKPEPRRGVLSRYAEGGPIETDSLHSPYSPIKMQKTHADQSAEYLQTHQFSEAPVMRPEDFKIGSSIVPLVGDRSAAGKSLVGLDGRKLSEPLPLEGGARYPHYQADMGQDGAWASGPAVTKMISNNVQRVANGNEVHGVYSAMGPRSVDFSTMMSDALLRQLPEAPIAKGALSKFDAQIRKNHPRFAGISDPSRADELREQLLKKGSLRLDFVKAMDDAKRQSAGFPDVASTRYAITDPTLRHAPDGTSGLTVAKMDTEASPITDPAIQHTSYPSQVKGAFSGGFEVPLSREEVFPDFFKGRRARGVGTGGDRRSFEISSVNQPVDQQWIDSLSEAIERKKATGRGW